MGVNSINPYNKSRKYPSKTARNQFAAIDEYQRMCQEEEADRLFWASQDAEMRLSLNVSLEGSLAAEALRSQGGLDLPISPSNSLNPENISSRRSIEG